MMWRNRHLLYQAKEIEQHIAGIKNCKFSPVIMQMQCKVMYTCQKKLLFSYPKFADDRTHFSKISIGK